MAWNEPGGKDPWTGGGDQGPPDLDEIVRKMQNRFGGLFGGRKGGGGGGGGRGFGAAGIGVVAIIIALLWAASGTYIVDEGKRGVVLEFGAFKAVTTPGLNWHIPYPVETVEVVDVEQLRAVEVGYRSGAGNKNVPVASEALMLTEDENIVNVQLAVQYQVKDPSDYLFNVRDPDGTLRQATESAVREVVGKSKMDFVLKEGRSEVALRTKALVQKILDGYKAGLIVVNVNLQDAQPPEEVQAAFADAIKAREDEVRQKNEAEAYSNDIIPKARGAAARILEEAQGYKQRKVAVAEGDAARFESLLAEYEKAPEVTRKRLYLETMETVLSNASKVTVDVSSSGNLLYLPLDRLAGSSSGDGGDQTMSRGGGNSSASSSSRGSGAPLPPFMNQALRPEPRRQREPR